MNPTAIAKACLAVAEALQQLAAALEAESDDRPFSQQMAERVHPTTEERMALHGLYVDGVPGRKLTDPPASVAEPECGCSLYTRCEQHNATRPKACRCNGPRFASSNCPLPEHRQVAAVYPHRDPARLD